MYQYPTGCWLGRGFPTNIQLVGGWVERVLNQYSSGWMGGWRGTQSVSNWLLLGGGIPYKYLTGCGWVQVGYITNIQMVVDWWWCG